VKIIFYDILDILTRQPCFYRNEYKTVLPDLAEGVTTYLNIELIKLNSASWEKLPSGLLLALIEPVAELQCKRTVIDGDQLAVEYEGSLEDGTVFDSSRSRGAPFGPFVQGNGQIIRGYELALAGRCLGERFKMIVPPHLAYGNSGRKSIHDVRSLPCCDREIGKLPMPKDASLHKA
jgi:hypothetical protein